MTTSADTSSKVILRTTGVSKKFGKFVALNNISAEFSRDAITSIIGPNGAGKSTYFNLLSGAFPPSSGKVEFEGRDVTNIAQHEFAHMGIAKSFQITNVFPLLTTAARKLFRSATSIRSSKCVPGERIWVTSRLTSLPGLASSVCSQMATLRPALSRRPM